MGKDDPHEGSRCSISALEGSDRPSDLAEVSQSVIDSLARHNYPDLVPGHPYK